MGDDKNLWALIVFVLAVIGVEYYVAIKKGDKDTFRAKNTISNFSIGIFDRFTGLFLAFFAFTAYHFIQVNWGIVEFDESSPWTWLLAFVVFDFWWYVYHLLGHRVNMFWGAHITHHQSEDYNYSVALNITPVQACIKYVIWAIIPLIGFSAKLIAIMYAANAIYQFLLHTKYIPKLGWAEKILVTPSHHRVHHGSNEHYIDKNFGGTLIVWDKLFGSFQEEIQEVEYGITKSINSRTFGNNLFHYYKELWFKTKQLPTLKEKLQLWTKGPEWTPKDITLESLPLYQPKNTYNYTISSGFKWYSAIQIALMLTLTAITAYYLTSLSVTQFVLLYIILISTLCSIGYILESKKRWVYFEALRGIALCLLVGTLYL